MKRMSRRSVRQLLWLPAGLATVACSPSAPPASAPSPIPIEGTTDVEPPTGDAATQADAAPPSRRPSADEPPDAVPVDECVGCGPEPDGRCVYYEEDDCSDASGHKSCQRAFACHISCCPKDSG